MSFDPRNNGGGGSLAGDERSPANDGNRGGGVGDSLDPRLLGGPFEDRLEVILNVKENQLVTNVL